MASITFSTKTQKNPANIYLRLSAGRGNDFTVKTPLKVDPERWSNKKESVKILLDNDKDDTALMDSVNGLRAYIRKQHTGLIAKPSKEWLTETINQYFAPKSKKASTLNEYIKAFIDEAKRGERKNEEGLNFVPGTVRSYKGFMNVFYEFQGIYSEDRREELLKDGKKLRPLKILDFDDVGRDFYEAFKTYLVDEGYKLNTIGRFFKILKYFMQKSFDEKLHQNREFLNRRIFKHIEVPSFSVYLTEDEIDSIYRKDVSKFPRMELARDAFICLCETALRVSDYPKIGLSIREVKRGKLLFITQTKTGDDVIIPLSKRMEEILSKYKGNLPRIHENYINKYIKTIASLCGINEVYRWEEVKYGKRFAKTAKKYELITCHTGRRTGATNMYRAGIPSVDIMKITGHRTESAFMRYIKISAEETAIRLLDHPYFNKKMRVV